MSVDSHVQVTKALLKRFRDKSGKVNYLDLTDGEIKSEPAGRLGVEYGYYSEEVETYLNHELEQPFNKLCNAVIHFLDAKNKVMTLRNPELICKRFATASLARSNLTLNHFYENSVTAGLFDDRSNHDALVLFSTAGEMGITPNGVLPFFNDFHFAIISNITSREFVIPRNCWYYKTIENQLSFVFPIAPKVALGLITDELVKRISLPDGIGIITIDDPYKVSLMNQSALRMEYAYNKAFVAASSVSELTELKIFMEDNHAALEKYRDEFHNA